MSVDIEKCSKMINPRFIPYLEKHRIYELFQDIGEALAMALPHDHVFFIRNLLMDMKELRGQRRIILVVPPQIDGQLLAMHVKGRTNMRVVGLKDLLKGDEDNIPMDEVAYRFNDLAARENLKTKGWIIYGSNSNFVVRVGPCHGIEFCQSLNTVEPEKQKVVFIQTLEAPGNICDFPRDSKEANFLQKGRIMPTHTLEIAGSPYKYSRTDAWCENVSQWKPEELARAMAAHQRRVFGLHQAFRSSYKKVTVEGLSLKELGEKLLSVSGQPVVKSVPLIPRVLLLGTRGSRRRTVAQRLQAILGIVHVDLEELMLGTLHLENEIGGEVRRLKEGGIPISFKIIISILKKRLLRKDCLSHGWVLTGFPRDLADLIELDRMDSPPNKIIFLSVDASRARERLENRRVNAYTGRLRSVQEIEADPFEEMSEYVRHPRDLTQNVVKEQEDFAKNVKEMLDYCGESCTLLDADESDDIVTERVCQLILKPSPVVPARQPPPAPPAATTPTSIPAAPAPPPQPGLVIPLDAMRFTLVQQGSSAEMYPQLDEGPVYRESIYLDF